MEQSVAKQNVVILNNVFRTAFSGTFFEGFVSSASSKSLECSQRCSAQEKTCFFLLFTQSRAYKARDEVGQNAVGQSKVDQNICFLNLCLETPVRKVL